MAPVNDLITEMGGWPVVSGSFTPSMTLEELLGTFLTKYGTDAIMSSSVIADPKNSTANIILVSVANINWKNLEVYHFVDKRAGFRSKFEHETFLEFVI